MKEIKKFAEDLLNAINKNFEKEDNYFFTGIMDAALYYNNLQLGKNILNEIEKLNKNYKKDIVKNIEKHKVEYFLQLPRDVQHEIIDRNQSALEQLSLIFLDQNSDYIKKYGSDPDIKHNPYVWACAYLAKELKRIEDNKIYR